MAIGDTAQTSVRLREVEDVHPTANVRHFDELSHREQECFLGLVEGRMVSLDGTSFDHGDVIVFTEYYRVVRA